MAEFETISAASEIRRKKRNPLYRNRVLIFALLAGLLLAAVITGVILLLPALSRSGSQVTMYAEINGIKMEDGGTYPVRVGDIIEVEASSREAKIYCIGYFWGYGDDDEIIDSHTNRITIPLPEKPAGYTECLHVEAVAANDDGSKNTETKTGWITYYLRYVDGEGSTDPVYDQKSGALIGLYRDAENRGRLLDGEGSLTLTDGTICEGEWDNGRPIGTFTCTFPCGSTYVGSIDRNHRPTGSGSFTYVDGVTVRLNDVEWVEDISLSDANESYSGMFADNTAQGFGLIHHAKTQSVYQGEIVNGKPCGAGEKRYANQNIYIGTWIDGKMNDYGTMYYADGKIYAGNWQDDIPGGQGTATYSSGTIYTGNWENGKPNGQGEVKYVHGDVYTGSLVDGILYGQGQMIFANGNIYTGAFADNDCNGLGTMTYANGDVYVGMWENDMRNGQGKITYAVGDVYDGEWVNDKLHGLGTMTYANGNVYVGTWENDMRNGQGKITYAVGDVYDGEWVDGKRHGQGTYTYASGDVYNGEWINNEMHGQCIINFANGDVYIGELSDNRPNGYGEARYANGNVYIGEFVDGSHHGHGTMTYADGTTYEGEWINGTRADQVGQN